jgi:hypothetical protein
LLHVEKQPIETSDRHGLGDLDAAGDAHADAERQLALFELFAGDVADGGHWRFPLRINTGSGQRDYTDPQGATTFHPRSSCSAWNASLHWTAEQVVLHDRRCGSCASGIGDGQLLAYPAIILDDVARAFEHPAEGAHMFLA